MKSVQWKAILAATAMTVVLSAPAQTQTVTGHQPLAGSNARDASEKATEKVAGLQEIVVTANRDKSNVQRTPIAVVAVTGDQLSNKGVANVADLVKVAPAIQFTPIRNKAIPYIRGIGQNISAGNADPSVAVNLNDAYLPAEMSNLGFFDVERVEVVYGPQGTLYGRNAVGGAINIITRRPGKDLKGDFQNEVGNYSSILVTGGVDMPISPELSVRLSGRGNWHSGYFTNGQSDAREWALRGTALYEPTDETTIVLVGAYSQQRGNGFGVQNVPPLTENPWYLPFDPKSVPLFTHANGGTVSLEIEQAIGSVHFKSISSFAKLNQHSNFLAYLNRPGSVQYVEYELHTRNLTQEFRLSGASSDLKWIVGLYGYDTRNGELSAVGQQVLPSMRFVTGPWSQHAQGAAIFGQLTYSVLPDLRLTAGGRLSYDRRELSGTNVNYFNTGAPAPAPTVIYSGTRSDTRPDFKLGIEYDPGLKSMLYANFQSGYNNGGFSTAQAARGSLAAAPFEPMTVHSWALGSKSRFFDDRLQLNLELFYNRYQNFQASARSLATGQATVFNAARAETYGAQFDARARIAPRDELGVTLSWLHAEFTEFVIPGAGAAPATNLSGFRMPLAPEAMVHVDYTHHFPLGNGATVDLAGNYRHVSGQWGVYNHLNGTFIKAYGMADASLTYTAPDSRWSAGAFVRNIGDVFTTAFTLGGAIPGPAVGIPLPPRTYGVRLTVQF